MGVTERLARFAARRAHVLVVEVPGHWVIRAILVRRIIERGWCVADSPAEAEILAICGDPGPELAEIVERVWDQLPGPRVRIGIDDANAVDSELASAAEQLVDTCWHRSGAKNRNGFSGQQTDPPLPAEDHSHHHGQGHEDAGRGDMDHGDMGHEKMDHGDMDMAPAGIPLAEGGDDRDGLEMDVLHLRLGPVLAHWPAGLVLRCSLQGDVIVEAQAWMVDAHRIHGAQHPTHTRPLFDAARRCDHLAGLLGLAGWQRAATDAGRARHFLLTSPDTEAAAAMLEKLRRQVARSRLLRWSLRGVGTLTVDDLTRHGLHPALRGDVHDRMLAMLNRALRVSNDAPPERDPDTSENVLEALPHLVAGRDLATARLLIASLDLDSELLAICRGRTHA